MSDFNEVYLGHPLCFSEEQCKCLSTNHNYEKYAQQVGKEYEKKYLGYKNFKTFAQNGISDGYKLIRRYLEKPTQELINLGFYDVNVDLLENMYGTLIYGAWMEVKSTIDELCQESSAEIREEEQYRAIRKASRGRIVGGGFGVKGAAKGIALAGAFNAASGLAHGTANVIGNSVSRGVQRRKLDELYKSNDMQQYVKESIEICIRGMGVAILKHQSLDTASNFIGTPEMQERVKAIRNNYFQVPGNQKLNVALQMLTLDPLDLEIYELLLQQFGDKDGVLSKLSQRLGISYEYKALLFKFRNSEFANITDRMNVELEQLQISDNNQTSPLEIWNKYKAETLKAVSNYGNDDAGINEYLKKLQYQYSNQISALQKSKFSQLLDRLDAEICAWNQTGRNYGKLLELKSRYEKSTEEFISFFGESAENDQYLKKLDQHYEKRIAELQESQLGELIDKLHSEMDQWNLENYKQKNILEIKNRYCEAAKGIISSYSGDVTTEFCSDKIDLEIKKQLQSALSGKYFPPQSLKCTQDVEAAEHKLRDFRENMPPFLKDTMDESLNRVLDVGRRVDIAERTYLSTVFDTKEDRQKAVADHQKLNQKYSDIFLGIEPPHIRLEKLGNLKQEVEQDLDLAPCVKEDLLAKILPGMETLAEEDLHRRTFKNKIFDTEEECNTVRRDYERLTEKFTTPNASYTSSDLKRAKKECQKGQYHPVAGQLALSSLELKEGSTSRSRRQKRNIWSIINVLLCILIVIFVVSAFQEEDSTLPTPPENVTAEVDVNNEYLLEKDEEELPAAVPALPANEEEKTAGLTTANTGKETAGLAVVNEGNELDELVTASEEEETAEPEMANKEEEITELPTATEPNKGPFDFESLVGTWLIRGAYLVVFEKDGSYYFNFAISNNFHNHLEFPVPLSDENGEAVAVYSDDGLGNGGTIRIYREDDEFYLTATVDDSSTPQYDSHHNLSALIVDHESLEYREDILEYPIYKDYLDPSRIQ